MPLATTTGRQTRPRRLMLYGVHGIGKSTFAAEAPNAVFLPTEDGIADIDCESYPLSSCFDQFMHYLQELHDEEHDRSTLVIDSLDWLERLIWAEVEKEQRRLDRRYRLRERLHVRSEALANGAQATRAAPRCSRHDIDPAGTCKDRAVYTAGQ